MVGETGFEPATLRSQTEYSTRLSYSPTAGVVGFFPSAVNGEMGAFLKQSVFPPLVSI